MKNGNNFGKKEIMNKKNSNTRVTRRIITIIQLDINVCRLTNIIFTIKIKINSDTILTVVPSNLFLNLGELKMKNAITPTIRLLMGSRAAVMHCDTDRSMDPYGIDNLLKNAT